MRNADRWSYGNRMEKSLQMRVFLKLDKDIISR